LNAINESPANGNFSAVARIRCHAKFLTSRHVRMHRVIFYISNMLRKLMT